MALNLKNTHPSWSNDLKLALNHMDPNYLNQLTATQNWLPGPEKIFSAFSLPKNAVKYILLGESPYPRTESANGYAFWDAAVGDLWSETGLTKPVNRATSLRNFIKMLLLADGLLKKEDLSQPAIQKIDKTPLIQTNTALFQRLQEKGFLLLNASPVFRNGKVRQDAKAWLPFIEQILASLGKNTPNLLLFGRIAETFNSLKVTKNYTKLLAPHPYNLSFITQENVINCFKPLTLLQKPSRIETQGR